MRTELLSVLRCPRCKAERSFDPSVREQTEDEIREGQLTCRGCGEVRAIERGIVDLMRDAPDFVLREQAGLDRFRRRHARRRLGPRAGAQPALRAVRLLVRAGDAHRPGARDRAAAGRRLDPRCRLEHLLGERALRRRGAAPDRAGHQRQRDAGPGDADWWHEDKGLYMERVLAQMFDLPLASDALDWVWCCEVLPHNHRANLSRTMRECWRVLKPGGTLIVANETLRSLRDPKLDPGKDVAQYDGHEHAYLRRSYVKAARDAGFAVEVRGPWYHTIFGTEEIGLSQRMTALQGFSAVAAHAIRRSERAKRAYLAWKAYVAGGTALHMLATKPAANP